MFIKKILITILIIFFSKEENFSIKFQKNMIYQNLLEINIKLNDKNFFVAIDLSSDIFWINNNFSQISYPNYENIIISQCEKINFSSIQEQNLKFNNDLIINNFSFVSFNNNNNNKECNFQGFIGMSHKILNKKINFLEQISQKKSVKKIFSLRFISDLIGEIKIGEHENDLLENKNKIVSFDAIDFDKKWAGNLQGIFFGKINNLKNDNFNVFYIENNNNNFFQINENFAFESIQNLIISNKNFFDNFIKEKIFRKFIKKKQCKIIEKNNFKGILCNKKIVDNLKNEEFIINLIINNSILKLNKNFLFEKYSNSEFLFIIVQSKIIKNWTIGNKILTLFTIIFDQEKDKIFLISKDKNSIERIRIIGEYNSNLDKDYSKLIYFEFSLLIILISNIFGIIFLLITQFRQKILISSKLKVKY